MKAVIGNITVEALIAINTVRVKLSWEKGANNFGLPVSYTVPLPLEKDYFPFSTFFPLLNQAPIYSERTAVKCSMIAK